MGQSALRDRRTLAKFDRVVRRVGVARRRQDARTLWHAPRSLRGVDVGSWHVASTAAGHRRSGCSRLSAETGDAHGSDL